MKYLLRKHRPEWLQDAYQWTTPLRPEELRHRHNIVIEIFKKHRPKRILDIGCADGNFTTMLGQVAGAEKLYGVDISLKAIENAKTKGVNAIQLDIDQQDLLFPNDFFDAIHAGEVIEHVFDPDHLLDEAYRTLRPKGLFVISTPNLSSIYNRIALLFGYMPFFLNPSFRNDLRSLPKAWKRSILIPVQSADHIRPFTFYAIKALLELHSFKVVETYGSKAPTHLVPNDTLCRFVGLIDKPICRMPTLSYIAIFECIKV